MKRIGRGVLSCLVALPAILFMVTGLRWMLDPGNVAPTMGLRLETGRGLSAQVGDLSAFFIVLGLCTLIGLVTGRRSWYYPPVMLLVITAVGRLVAWALHGAAFPVQTIGFEIAIALFLLVSSQVLPERD